MIGYIIQLISRVHRPLTMPLTTSVHGSATKIRLYTSAIIIICRWLEWGLHETPMSRLLILSMQISHLVLHATPVEWYHISRTLALHCVLHKHWVLRFVWVFPWFCRLNYKWVQCIHIWQQCAHASAPWQADLTTTRIQGSFILFWKVLLITQSTDRYIWSWPLWRLEIER